MQSNGYGYDTTSNRFDDYFSMVRTNLLAQTKDDNFGLLEERRAKSYRTFGGLEAPANETCTIEEKVLFG